MEDHLIIKIRSHLNMNAHRHIIILDPLDHQGEYFFKINTVIPGLQSIKVTWLATLHFTPFILKLLLFVYDHVITGPKREKHMVHQKFEIFV